VVAVGSLSAGRSQPLQFVFGRMCRTARSGRGQGGCWANGFRFPVGRPPECPRCLRSPDPARCRKSVL